MNARSPRGFTFGFMRMYKTDSWRISVVVVKHCHHAVHWISSNHSSFHWKLVAFYQPLPTSPCPPPLATTTPLCFYEFNFFFKFCFRFRV